LIVRKDNATIIFGKKQASINIGQYGCAIMTPVTEDHGTYFIDGGGHSNGGLYFYGSFASYRRRPGNFTAYTLIRYPTEIIDCVFNKVNIMVYSSTVINRLLSMSPYVISASGSGLNVSGFQGGVQIQLYVGATGIIKDSKIQSTGNNCLYMWAWTGTIHLLDCEMDNYNSNWGGGSNGTLYRQHRFNLHLTDKDGNVVSGASVILKDKDNNQVFNEETSPTGEVTFSGQHFCPEDNAVTHTRFYYEGGGQADYRGPWTLSITKAGYQDYQDVILIDRKMDLEVALTPVPPPVYVPVPSGEVDITLAAVEPLGLALEADGIKVQLDEA
jgi:hypothetical protein